VFKLETITTTVLTDLFLVIKEMTIEEMTNLLRKEIPLCEFMKMEITSLEKLSITTSAPLEPNRNMHGTGFAGSLYSLAVATGWSLVHNRLNLAKVSGQLVVKEATIHYRRPVTSDIELRSKFEEPIDDCDLLKQLSSGGRVKFPLIVTIFSKGKKCAYLEADYTVVAT
jgi:thioesterase domain-containing protein